MDLAGLVILLIIAALAAVTSIQQLVHPQPLTQPRWVALAALVGFAGNELVAHLVDPIVGLLITIAILAIVGRLLDAIDPPVVGGSPSGSGHVDDGAREARQG